MGSSVGSGVGSGVGSSVGSGVGSVVDSGSDSGSGSSMVGSGSDSGSGSSVLGSGSDSGSGSSCGQPETDSLLCCFRLKFFFSQQYFKRAFHEKYSHSLWFLQSVLQVHTECTSVMGCPGKSSLFAGPRQSSPLLPQSCGQPET